MDSSLISRLVKLIGKNNDRIILPDPETGRTVVIMDLEAYEALLGGQTSPSKDASGEARPMFPTPAKSFAKASSEAAPRRAPVPDLESVMEPVAEDEIDLPAPMPKKPRNFAKNPRQQSGPETVPFAGLKDLTQAELLDKINRDIGEWKTAQEVKRAEELQSAAGQRPVLAVTESLEDEERFYLEPIE